MTLSRRDTLVLTAAAAAMSVCGLGTAAAAEGDMLDVAKLMAPAEGYVDHILGDAAAPVTVIEYASVTCPHCATFSNDVYPAFKSAYIDTGKVRFVLRPFMRNTEDARVFMIAEAAQREKYHEVIEAYFKTQEVWINSEPELQGVALQLGFTKESITAALDDTPENQKRFAQLNALRNQALDEFGLEGTPTFYINGKQLTGDKTLEQLAAEIDPLVPSGFVAKTPDTATPAVPAVETSTPVAQ